MKNQQQQTEFNSIFSDSQLLKLQIKQSQIPGSGLGLFAKDEFQSGEFIAEYYGAIIPESMSFSQPFLMEDKMVSLGKKYCVISRSPASRVNDIVKWEPEEFMSKDYQELKERKEIRTIEGKKRNAKIRVIGKNKAFIEATAPISKGEEIYISYGYIYWEFFFQEALKQKKQNSEK